MDLSADLVWLIDHLDDIVARTFQHVVLAAIGVFLGFLISFGLAIIAVRRRGTYGPILAVSDVLYTIPSLAVFAALIAVTGISIVTVVVPLVMYTLVIFVRNIAAGLDSVQAEVLEAADGLGYTGRQRLWHVEVPLAVPLIVAGLRLAAVSTIALVTVTSVMGDSFGGLGFFILEGYRRSFPLELYTGAIASILLAFTVDWLLTRLERRITPWARESAAPDPATMVGQAALP